MGTSENFCLRWNDFESNISSSFRNLRMNQDFFDVSLAVEEDHVVKAHKVILAACSPFFRNVLAKQNMALPFSHPHPVIYLRGIKIEELRYVLDFMYHGEVSVAQEDLNTFLAVAEDLQIKGLTQDGDKGENGSFCKPQRVKKLPMKRVEPSDREENGPPAKKRISQDPNVQDDDDDVQDVIPVKQEINSELHIEDPPFADTVSAQVSEDYEEAGSEEDFGQFEETDDYIDPQPSTSDGSKDASVRDPLSSLLRTNEGWKCKCCDQPPFLRKNDAKRHVEARHGGVKNLPCLHCTNVYKNKFSLQNHLVRSHNHHVPLKLLANHHSMT